MEKCIKPGSKLVADKWKATVAAARIAGVAMEGAVNHTENWRDPDTGTHSNDAESEFARLRLFLKSKFGKVRASSNTDPGKKDDMFELHLAEYMFYTNVGRSMSAIMKAFKHMAEHSQ